jgi:HAD superfamily hydrolase (TIGR01450 family)
MTTYWKFGSPAVEKSVAFSPSLRHDKFASMNLGAVTTLVFDLDGIVWRGDAPIASAISAINDLRAAGKRCLFCTNNSAQTQADFVAKLAGMGVEGVAEEEVITSSSATALYLSAQYTGPFLAYVIGGEGIHLALQKIGARIVPDIDIDDNSNVDCVVAGIWARLSLANPASPPI